MMPPFRDASPARPLADERQEILEREKPKIVDAKKYYGPAVLDFANIKARLKELDS